ncbi:hypothetical protein SDJN03_23155, partial [Cucurbita argyrosperma subsp. sororia]
MLATIIVGVVFNLLQIAFSLFNIVKNRNGTILFDFFADKFLSYLLVTSTAAGFGVSVDLQRTKDPEDLFGTFFGKKLRRNKSRFDEMGWRDNPMTADMDKNARYVLATIIIGIVFNLLQIAFSLLNIVKGATGTILFDFFGDKFLSYLLATGTAAGFGLSVDLQTLDPDDYFGTFFDKAYAASALLLFAFFCSAAVSIISSFALSKRP